MKNISVLLVEDSESVVDTVQCILFKYKPTKQNLPDIEFTLSVAKSFESAYRFKNIKFDLVLLDDRLPQKDSDPKNRFGNYIDTAPRGYQLIKSFKESGAYVVGTSSESTTADYDTNWNKSGISAWEDLLKILIFVSSK